MPAIADLVASLEHDHAHALAKIEALNAANAALAEAINALTTEKAALEAKIAELGAHTDGMIAMVENVANGALDMLKAARLPSDTPAAVIPFAPKPKTVTAASVAPSVGLADVLITEEMLKPEPARVNDTAPRTVPSRAPKPAAAPIIAPASAVDRFKQHFLPALTLMRRPVDQTMHVKHDPGGLPMFLRRDTVFTRAAAHG
jgi:hypothetical protein